MKQGCFTHPRNCIGKNACIFIGSTIKVERKENRFTTAVNTGCYNITVIGSYDLFFIRIGKVRNECCIRRNEVWNTKSCNQWMSGIHHIYLLRNQLLIESTGPNTCIEHTVCFRWIEPHQITLPPLLRNWRITGPSVVHTAGFPVSCSEWQYILPTNKPLSVPGSVVEVSVRV